MCSLSLKLLLSLGAVFLVDFVPCEADEMRWCKVTNASSNSAEGPWIHYNDATHVCVNCSSDSIVLMEISLVRSHECCNGTLTKVGTCKPNDEGETKTCTNAIKCDHVKQCVNGSDEMGCGQCGAGEFFCPSKFDVSFGETNCFSQNKVCDSTKDCILGLDETGCLWHRGWCDGFLCGKPNERCIAKTQICDGVKDCIDGADETNCHYCVNQFQCSVYERTDVGSLSDRIRTGECMGKFRVCDGIEDCSNGLDESNCYRWREWSTWSRCRPPTVCTRNRSRVCINGGNLSEVNPNFCYDVDDFYKFQGVPSVEQQSELCPPCIPLPPPTAPPASAKSNPITKDNKGTTVGIANRQNKGNAFTTEENINVRRTSVTAPILPPLVPSHVSILVRSATTKPNYVIATSTKQSVMMTSLVGETKNIQTTSRSNYDVKKGSSVQDSTSNPNVNATFFFLNSTIRPFGAFPEGPSIYSFILIIICTTAGALVLMIIGCVAMCVCSERKRKRGNVKLRKKSEEPNFGIGSTLNEMQTDGNENTDKANDDDVFYQEITIARIQSSSSSTATPASSPDSGIDDEHSMSSHDVSNRQPQFTTFLGSTKARKAL